MEEEVREQTEDRLRRGCGDSCQEKREGGKRDRLVGEEKGEQNA